MPTPSINISFALSATTVTIPGPPGQTDIAPSARFVTDLSANHTRWTYQVTTAQKFLWSMSVMDLTEQQRSDFQAFFENIAKGPTYQFTYTHTDGLTYTARFIDTVLKWGRLNDKSFSTNFTLEFDSTEWTPAPTTTTTTTAAP